MIIDHKGIINAIQQGIDKYRERDADPNDEIVKRITWGMENSIHIINEFANNAYPSHALSNMSESELVELKKAIDRRIQKIHDAEKVEIYRFGEDGVYSYHRTFTEAQEESIKALSCYKGAQINSPINIEIKPVLVSKEDVEKYLNS